MENITKLIKIAKIILPSDSYKTIKKIKTNHEKVDVLKYSIINAIERRINLLESRVKNIDNFNKDYLFASSYFKLLPSKIAHLKSHFSEHNLLITMELISKIEKEVFTLNV